MPESAQAPDRFGFVVLNYVNDAETVACVRSILALPAEGFHVVVVDNDSPNGAFERLRDAFDGDTRVEVLPSGRNGGYSFGNNVGIRRLARLGIHDVIIATSDTRVEDPHILAHCLECKRLGAAVVGPRVLDLDGCEQNPVLHRLTLRYVVALHGGRVWEGTKALVRRWLRRRADAATAGPAQAHPAPSEVYMVHGCFLYLSSAYLAQFPELDDELFMYGEEDLIAFNCLLRRLPVLYDPRIVVRHGDAKSTGGGAFRQRHLATSMATLRRKIPAGKLLHACLAPRAR